MHDESLLRATDQVRKLHLAAAAGVAAAVVLAIAESFNSSLAPATFAILLICGAALLIVAFLYPAAAVRCPSCHLHWVSWSIGNQPHTQWLHWLFEFTVCPGCGYSRSRSSEHSNAP
jgi:hypothetical protein